MPRALPAALVALALAGCGSGAPPFSADPAEALRRSLVGRDLAVRWVACAPARERIRASAVYRCNVSFGDPHVQVFCAAFVAGELRAAEWVQAARGAQDRAAAARECAERIRASA